MIKYKESKSQLIEDGKERYLELVLRDAQLEEFRINMINNNSEKGFIKVEKSKFNTDTNLRYCITGYESLDVYISKNMLDKQKTIKILKGISEVLLKSSKALLKIENFIIEKENIFINKESLEIKLINIPLKENYCSNINESYMNMVRDLMDYALINNKVKADSASFVISIKNIVEDGGLTINDFINRIEGDLGNKSNISIKNDSNKIISTPQIKNENDQSKLKANSKNDNNRQKVCTEINGLKINENSTDKEEVFETLEKKQYKLSRIIISIVIQPIFIGIILSLLLFEGVTTVQIIGGGLLLLALDGVIIKNLLDPSKKETVKIKVKVNKKSDSNLNGQVNENKKNKEKKLDIQNQEIKENIEKSQQIQAVSPEAIEVEGVYESIDGPATLEDEGTTIETIAYLEVDNGKEVRTEEITTDSYVIGRSENLKNYISSTNVSRRHIEIIKSNEQYFIKDLKSKNGTKLNGIRLNEGEKIELNIGDVIEIPDLVLKFKL